LGACSSASSPSKAASSRATGTAASASAFASASASTAAADGNIGLSADQLTAAIASATKAVSGVYVKGALLTTTGRAIGMDAHLNADDTSTGSVAFGGVQAPFVAYNGNYYMQMTSSVAAVLNSTFSTSDFSTAPTGSWISVPESTGALDSTDTVPLSVQIALTDVLPGTLFDLFVPDFTTGVDSWTATPDGTGTFDGQTAAKYTVGDTTFGDLTLWLPAHGAALPLGESGNGASGGTMTFTWNSTAKVAAPAANQIYSDSGSGS
jgi:hypothetical protein